MIRPIVLTLLSLTLIAAGCAREPSEQAAEAGERAAAATADTVAPPKVEKATVEKAVAKPKKAVQVKKPTPGERKARRAIEWPAGVEWAADWAAAQAASAESGRPICLVVYADWCPRCKELVPLFAEADLIEASKGLIMVYQDNDARPDWMQAYADQGSYVPRIFFFGPDGNLRTDITSGHPRYPFFYSSRQKKALIKSMKTATGA